MNDHSDDLEVEEPSAEIDESVDVLSAQRTIYTEQGDPEVESLYGKFKRGKLIVQSDFQRKFVWDRTKASRLIESALLDIPLPVIYLSQEKDGKEYVIDGQQRLTSFFSFIDGKFPDGANFILTNLKVFAELVGKSFRDIGEAYQDKVRFCRIRTITFRKESQPDLKFEIFERLNTGAVSLNDQELRNCIYRGPYNDLLKELAKDQEFMALLGLKTPDKRMKDVELVLRFASFYHSTYLKYRPSMSRFLNDEMRKHQFINDEEAGDLRAAFRNAVSLTKSVFGNHAFKRFYPGTQDNPNGRWEPTKFNASLFDIVMFSFARLDKHLAFRHLDAIREGLIWLMSNDQEFIDAIELGTSGSQSIVTRFDVWRRTVQDIVATDHKEARCFSLSLKNSLYQNSPYCAICSQKIQIVDDSEVDHEEQFWRGGRTVPENARLTHRFCNRSRSRLGHGQVNNLVIRSQRNRGGFNVTPRGRYRPLILGALMRLGGRARQREVLEMIERNMEHEFTPDDRLTNEDGYTIKWKNLAAFERLEMVKEGLLRDDSDWGIWELTDRGRQVWREYEKSE